jgi:hypothetical protein
MSSQTHRLKQVNRPYDHLLVPESERAAFVHKALDRATRGKPDSG